MTWLRRRYLGHDFRNCSAGTLQGANRLCSTSAQQTSHSQIAQRLLPTTRRIISRTARHCSCSGPTSLRPRPGQEPLPGRAEMPTLRYDCLFQSATGSRLSPASRLPRSLPERDCRIHLPSVSSCTVIPCANSKSSPLRAATTDDHEHTDKPFILLPATLPVPAPQGRKPHCRRSGLCIRLTLCHAQHYKLAWMPGSRKRPITTNGWSGCYWKDSHQLLRRWRIIGWLV